MAIGDLPPGATVTIVFQASVDDPVAAGVAAVSNQGTVSGSNFSTVSTDDADVGGAADPTVTPVAAVPDLVLVKSDGGATGVPGGVGSSTLQVTNVGVQGATGVELADTVPANATFDAGASSGVWSCVPDATAGSVCTQALGAVAGAGGTAVATFAVRVDDLLPAAVDAITSCATVADDGANGADPTPGDNQGCDATPIDATPNLAVTKTDGVVTASPGATVTYQIAVDNVGDQGATGVELTETVPANATLDLQHGDGQLKRDLDRRTVVLEQHPDAARHRRPAVVATEDYPLNPAAGVAAGDLEAHRLRHRRRVGFGEEPTRPWP